MFPVNILIWSYYFLSLLAVLKSMLIIPISGLYSLSLLSAMSSSSISWCFVSWCARIFDWCLCLSSFVGIWSLEWRYILLVRIFYIYAIGPCTYSTTSLRSQWSKFTLVMCIWEVDLRRASLRLQFPGDVVPPFLFFLTLQAN